MQDKNISSRLHNSLARNEKIDLLRFIGLAMIILAHVGSPTIIAQLRNFDVPLMVLVSGAAFAVSYRDEFYASYVWKRVKRLLFPTWIFLSAYFLCMLATNYPMPLPSLDKIIDSYLLISGIGYVWIIRVFLLVALVAPMILKFNNSSVSHGRFFTILLVAYLIYEAVLFASKSFNGSAWATPFQNIILYIIPYAIFFAVGIRLPQLSPKGMLAIFAIAFTAFCVTGLILWKMSGQFVLTQTFKYPPSIYYLSYALAVSTILWMITDKILILIKHLNIAKPVMFVAQNSIWIYLWHIPLLQMIDLSFYLKYPLVFGIASGITYIQVSIIKQALIPRLKNPTNIRNLSYLFTG